MAEQIYSTIKKILIRILAEDADFPIQATTLLWWWMRKLGFVYKRTSKVIVPLDTPTFMAARARYFAAIDELRTSGSKICWHDETWCDKNEERRFVWTDGQGGNSGLQSLGVPWSPLESRGVPWSPVESLGVPWSPLESLGVPWSPLESLGVPWNPLESHGVPWSPVESLGIPWSPLESRGVPWSPLECLGVPRSPVESCGFPRSSYKYYKKSTKLR